MLKIAHRINTVEQLIKVDKTYGIEIDIRYEGKNLVLHHDPLRTGDELLDDFLKAYNHQFVILNVKTEGIEKEVLRLLAKYSIKNYFFLDLSLPYLIKYMNLGEDNIAVRYSEYEPIEFVLAFKGKVKWVWIDYFTKNPLTVESYLILKNAGFKLCIVSPELQGHSINTIEKYKRQLKKMDISAVCTKRPDLW